MHNYGLYKDCEVPTDMKCSKATAYILVNVTCEGFKFCLRIVEKLEAKID